VSDDHGGPGALILLATLVLAAYAVPYTLLRGVESFAAAFLFWTLFGAAAVGVILHILRGWRV
jgi:hypothetical protein